MQRVGWIGNRFERIQWHDLDIFFKEQLKTVRERGSDF